LLSKKQKQIRSLHDILALDKKDGYLFLCRIPKFEEQLFQVCSPSSICNSCQEISTIKLLEYLISKKEKKIKKLK
jgi:hypothetical protein